VLDDPKLFGRSEVAFAPKLRRARKPGAQQAFQVMALMWKLLAAETEADGRSSLKSLLRNGV
jgi:hypothetical protein